MIMTKTMGEDSGRQQQGDGQNLASQYRAIGIPAINAAALCKPKAPPRQQSQAIPASMYEAED
jgi:hypothetical protein